jgi:hypothetical protein
MHRLKRSFKYKADAQAVAQDPQQPQQQAPQHSTATGATAAKQAQPALLCTAAAAVHHNRCLSNITQTLGRSLYRAHAQKQHMLCQVKLVVCLAPTVHRTGRESSLHTLSSEQRPTGAVMHSTVVLDLKKQ